MFLSLNYSRASSLGKFEVVFSLYCYCQWQHYQICMPHLLCCLPIAAYESCKTSDCQALATWHYIASYMPSLTEMFDRFEVPQFDTRISRVVSNSYPATGWRTTYDTNGCITNQDLLQALLKVKLIEGDFSKASWYSLSKLQLQRSPSLAEIACSSCLRQTSNSMTLLLRPM